MRRENGFKRVARLLLPVFLSMGMVAATASGAFARPFRMGKLPDKGKAFGCGTCHQNPRGGGPKNPFGRDYARMIPESKDSYTAELGAADSDGDGFSNDEEFSAGTHAGDATSKP